MKCDFCHREVPDDVPLAQPCADVIPPFTLPPPLLGTEMALELAAELAPFLTEDET